MAADKGKEILNKDTAGEQVPEWISNPDTVPNPAAGRDDLPEELRGTVEDVLQKDIQQRAELYRTYKKNRAKIDPLIKAELEKPEYNGLTLDELLNLPAGKAEIFYSLISSALEKLRAEDIKPPIITGGGVPKNFIIPNSYVMQLFKENSINPETGEKEYLTDIKEGIYFYPLGGKSKIETFVMAKYDNPEINGQPVSEFTWAVISAWLTRYLDARRRGLVPFVTYKMLCRTLMHKTEAEDVSPNIVNDVKEEVERLLHLDTFFTASEEMKQRKATYNNEPVEEFSQGSKFLEALPTKIKAGGKEVSGYVINESASLLYFQITRQVITVPGGMLDIKTIDKKGKLVSITYTKDRISIIHYLARRIEIMRRDEKQASESFRKYTKRARHDTTLPVKALKDFRSPSVSRTILADTILKEAGASNSKNTVTNNKKFILQVVDYYTVKGYIGGYEKRRSGKTYDAITVFFTDS